MKDFHPIQVGDVLKKTVYSPDYPITITDLFVSPRTQKIVYEVGMGDAEIVERSIVTEDELYSP